MRAINYLKVTRKNWNWLTKIKSISFYIIHSNLVKPSITHRSPDIRKHEETEKRFILLSLTLAINTKEVKTHFNTLFTN